jgi:hypothetical protein
MKTSYHQQPADTQLLPVVTEPDWLLVPLLRRPAGEDIRTVDR